MTTGKALFPIVLLLFISNGLACCSDKEGQVVLEMEGGYCSKWHLCKPPLTCEVGGFGGFEDVGTCTLPKETGAACKVGDTSKPCPQGTKCLDGFCRVELGIGESCRDLQRTTCAKDLQCRGSLRERSCERGLDAGYRCDGVHLYCKAGLDCRAFENVNRCITRLKENNICGMKLSMCGNGLECVSFKGKRLCRKVTEEGKVCDIKKDMICGAGQACLGGKCRTLKGVYQACGKPFDQCTLGTNCTDTMDVRRCIPLKPMGTCPIGNMTAGSGGSNLNSSSIDIKYDPTGKPVSKPTVAVTAVPVPTDKPAPKPDTTDKSAPVPKPVATKPPASKPVATKLPTSKPVATKQPTSKPVATKPPASKTDPTKTSVPTSTADAATKPADKPMVTAVPIGGSTSTDKTTSTTTGKIPSRGDVCDVLANNCGKNHVCLGEKGSAKCHFVQRGWGDCKGQFALCKPGWHCRGPVGSRLCLLASQKGKRCDNAYFKCEAGLTCMRWGGQTVCIEFKAAGASCESEFDVCDAGLSCSSSTKTCVATVADDKLKITQGFKQPCNATNICTSGNVCVGPTTDAKCMGWLSSEARCEDKAYVCGGGTGCRGLRGKAQICKKTVPRGKGCDNEYHFCEKGLTCMLWGPSLRCVAFRDENEDCTGAQILCTAGMKCSLVASGNRTCLPPGSPLALKTVTVSSALGGGTTTVSSGTNTSTTLEGASVGGASTPGTSSTTRTSTITYGNGTVVTTITTTFSNGTVVVKKNSSGSPSASPSGSALPTLKTDFIGISIPIFTAVPIPAVAIALDPTPSTTPTPSPSVVPAIVAVKVACPLGCKPGYWCLDNTCVLYGVLGESCDGITKKCRSGLTCQVKNSTTTEKECRMITGKGKGCGTASTLCGAGLECIAWGSAKRCVEYIDAGGNCQYTFDLCREGFFCRQLAGDEHRKCH